MSSRTLLLVTYYFPPHGGGAAVRMLKLAKYLSREGWRVLVLTSDGRRHVHLDPDLLGELPADVLVTRAASLEASAPGLEKRMAGGGGSANLLKPLVQLKRRLLFPDERAGWAPAAILSGLSLLRRHRPDAVLSSSPPVTAHLVGRFLARRAGIPWVADFRDGWISDPLADPAPGDRARRWESRLVRDAAGVLGATPGIAEDFRTRYPEAAGRVHWIPNGFDPEDRRYATGNGAARKDAFLLTSVGVGRYTRDIAPVLDALAAAPRVRLRLVGSTFPAAAALAREKGVGDRVEVFPLVSRHKALALLGASDASLLVLGAGADSRSSFATSLFDYLMIGKPLLAVADPGPAADLVAASGLGKAVAPGDAAGIRAALLGLAGATVSPRPEALAPYDRRLQAGRISGLLDGLVAARRRPRILMVAQYFDPAAGGSERQACQQAEDLASEGIPVTVLARRALGVRAQGIPGVHEIRVGSQDSPGPLEPRGLSVPFFFGCRVAAHILRHGRDYDVVHLHGVGLPAMLAVPAAKLRGLKVLAKVSAANTGWEAGSLKGRWGPAGWLARRVFQEVDLWIAISGAVARGLVSDGIGTDRIRRIPNGVDLSRFRPLAPAERAEARARLGWPDSARVALVVGRQVPFKGTAPFVKAWRAAAKPEGVLLAVAGDGPELGRLEADPSVRLLGWRRDPEVLMGTADLLVHPSRDQEGMPNAVAEAMACGLPVAAFRVGGVEDLVTDGVDGALETEGNDAGLARTALDLLVDPGRLEALGRSARRRAEGLGRKRVALDILELCR